jgi:hypothetical protein
MLHLPKALEKGIEHLLSGHFRKTTAAIYSTKNRENSAFLSTFAYHLPSNAIKSKK